MFDILDVQELPGSVVILSQNQGKRRNNCLGLETISLQRPGISLKQESGTHHKLNYDMCIWLLRVT